MPLARIEDHEAALARRFLLGTLDTEESSQFEARLLEDDALFELVEAVEDELLDAFVRDTLEPGERKSLAPRFERLPERLRFARALARRAARPARTRRIAAWAAAAAIVILAGTAVLLTRRTAAPATPAAPIASRKIGRPVNVPNVEKIVALSLALATTRGEAASPRFVIPTDASTVALAVRIHPADRFPAYAVVVRHDGGIVAWQGRAAPPAANDLSVTIPAAIFTPGRYEIGVAGIDARGRSEDLGEQTFTVTAAAPSR